jgi:lipooligosaccharide transport system permease protein
MALRVLSTTTIFLAVMAVFGAATSWWAVLAVPAGLLTGMAFAAPIAAMAASQDNDMAFAAIFRFVIVPMFLFSGTFFPVSQLPPALRVVAYLTPLWHGVELTRSLALGTATPGPTAAHVLYLSAWVVGGVAVARATYRRRLVR